MQIENVHIHLGRAGPLAAAALFAALAGDRQATAPVAPQAAQQVQSKPPRIGEFWTDQGGVYAGVMRGANGAPDYHLIVGSEEVQSIAWGGYGTKVDGADSESDGLANTQALCSAPSDHPAAQWAAGLAERDKSDWYLPSRRELRLLWVNVPELFSKDGWYWSSTQYSGDGAWGQSFDNGFQLNDAKKAELRARAVRRLIL